MHLFQIEAFSRRLSAALRPALDRTRCSTKDFVHAAHRERKLLVAYPVRGMLRLPLDAPYVFATSRMATDRECGAERNIMRHSIRAAGLSVALLPLAAGVLASAPAVAAPFCLQNEAIPAQCIYYDATDCQRRAAQMHGFCTANPAEVTVTPGNGQYC
ncbi:MAG: hypothetical protein M3Y41_07385, partial [Pseudomonadota bacterium]|nr:hypothetical protein [Pseudomonadota bacterium]